MNDKEIKLQTRLYALEVMVSNLYVINLASSGYPKEVLEAIRGKLLVLAREVTVPSTDPATSDLIAAEFEDALSRLLSMVGDQIDRTQEHRQS
jgi:hypothetical protein